MAPARFSSGRVLALLAVLAIPLPASAQDSCPTGTISFVFIDNHSIFDTSEPGLDKRFGWAYRVANALHVRTKRRVIERELLVRPGDCYDPFLISESERLLRGYDFLGQVEVAAVPQPDGSYHVMVETQDDWSTQVDLRLGVEDGLAVEGLGVREANLLGTGQELGFYYIERDVTRDYGIAFSTPQLAGTRWDFGGELGRTRAGTSAREVVAYPFVAEVGRWGARQSFARDDRYFDYILVDSTRGHSQHVLLPVREKMFDVGVGTRLGPRGSLTVLGLLLMFEELTYPGAVLLAAGNDFDQRVAADSATVAQLQSQLQPLGSIRAGLVLGQRNIWWVKRRGLDSMRGQQDVPLGAEVGVTFARSIPSLERDDDFIATLKFYTGLAAGPWVTAARLRLDARRDFDALSDQPEWEDFYADAELLAYFKASETSRHTFVVRTAATGGWNTRTPFQLTLGGDRNLRGYRYERFPGGRRVVVNVEDRIFLGWPLRDVLDIGTTVFLDAGRIWPGDAPFGEDSGWRATAGIGLRGSFPAGSRTTYRLDLAMPVENGLGGKFRLIISASELIGLKAASTPDVQLLRSRSDGTASELFRFRTN